MDFKDKELDTTNEVDMTEEEMKTLLSEIGVPLDPFGEPIGIGEGY